MVLSAKSLEDALELLGELLADRNIGVEVVAIGGGSLLLMGWIERPTKDLDIVAVVRAGKYASARPCRTFCSPPFETSLQQPDYEKTGSTGARRSC